MIISAIVAVTNNNCIGKNNELLWHLPVDMAYFKKITSGGTVLMGRKTYNSIPNKFKPLPNRLNLIVSKDANYRNELKDLQHANLRAFESIEEAIAYADSLHTSELFIIGGAEVYKQTREITDKIYLTKVDCDLNGDAYFDTLEENKWELIEKFNSSKDDKNKFDCTFLTYIRKKK